MKTELHPTLGLRPRETTLDDSIWYEAQCIVTNVAMSFEPGQTDYYDDPVCHHGSGPTEVGHYPRFLLQEDDDYLLEESDGRILQKINSSKMERTVSSTRCG